MSDMPTVFRALAEESEDLGAGAGAAIALAAVLVCTLVGIGLVRFRRTLGHGGRVADLPVDCKDDTKSWLHDPEKGEVPPEAAPEQPEKPTTTKSVSICSSLCSFFSTDSTTNTCSSPIYAQRLIDPLSQSQSKVEFSPAAQNQLGCLLRQLLEQEVSGSIRNGLMGRLDAFEHEVVEALKRDKLRHSPAGVASPARLGGPPTQMPKLQPETIEGGSQTAPPALKFEKGIPVQEDLGFQFAKEKNKVPEKVFGPTKLQRTLPKPPEKPAPLVPETVALKSSLAAVHQNLASRDRQTAELQKQLKDCRQALLEQTEVSKESESRLRRLLESPGKTPQTQAEELARLQEKISALSARLTDAKASESYWSVVAKRQRAFFLQSEQHGPEAMQLLKRHPCGEVFVAPAPILGEAGDMGPAWDVGTSHANPYVCDSWPFEPNVLSKRTPQEPTMQPLEEDPEAEDEVSESEEEEEEFACMSPSKKASGTPGFWLPSVPAVDADKEGKESDEDSLIEVPHSDDNVEGLGGEEGSECPHGSLLDRLPQMPQEVETARSL